ncbi:MAG: type I secretion system permease/ATPase [Rickettsiales bacterium]
MSEKKPINPLVQALTDCKKAFIVTFFFSFCVNLLNLITPLYSLQVLDRVISSGSKDTLLMLTIIIVFIYISFTLLQVARSFTLIKIGEWLDQRISPKLFSHAVESASQRPSMGAAQSIREFNTIKQFLTSSGINSIFDAPWSIIYIIVVFLIHPMLGWLTIVGAIIIIFLAFLNAYAVNSTLSGSTEHQLKGAYLADIATRNAETVQAMGMMNAVRKKWAKENAGALKMQSTASYRNGVLSNTTRFFRSILQMGVTGIGAYIVITTNPQEMTVGNMIASSIIVGRALAPFDQMIEVWKQVTSASKSYKKIKSSFDKEAERPKGMSFPHPEGRLTVENVFFAPHNSKKASDGNPQYTLKGLNFTLEPGKSLAIIGPSGAGKSTLARILVGVWKPNSGSVRIDNADVFSWDREDFGKHIGYLPQGIELFNGSIKDNIARMHEDPDDVKVVEAAKLAGAHEMISHFDEGYEKDIGLAGNSLSGGQKQRVGLARAFYGNPKLVVLDEPNANLDDKGEAALVQAIKSSKDSGTSTIVISHRPAILQFVDMIMIIQEGSIVAYGPKEDIMARFKKDQTPVKKD